MLRESLVQAACHPRVRRIMDITPLPRTVLGRLIAGTTVEDAVLVSQGLVRDGLTATVDRLGPDPQDLTQARAVRDHLMLLVGALADGGATAQGRVGITVRPAAVGMLLPRGGERIALEHVFELCEAAARVGTTVTLGPVPVGRVPAVLDLAAQVRPEYPGVAVTLAAAHRRTLADCRDLAQVGARVALIRRSGPTSAQEGWHRRHDVDRSFALSMRALIKGSGDVLVATPDRVMLEICDALAAHARRRPGSVEVLWPHGVRSAVLRRRREAAHPVRISVPYGQDWYDGLSRHLLERPADPLPWLRQALPRA